MILRRITQHVKDQNWVAIAIDFVIVVIGVGVALMGQKWLADQERKGDLARAEVVLRNDLATNYYFAKERLAVKGCRLVAYEAIADKLLEDSKSWTGMPRDNTGDDFTVERALPTVLRSPSRSWGSVMWEAELARGTFADMDHERREMLTLLFDQAAKAETLQDEIEALQPELSILALDTDLDRAERLRLYGVVAKLDSKSGLLEVMASQTVEFIESIGIDFPDEAREELAASLTALNERARRIYGDCYEDMVFDVLEPDDAGTDEATG